jgi:hypothetical protein
MAKRIKIPEINQSLRSTCIVCRRKRMRFFLGRGNDMLSSHWACKSNKSRYMNSCIDLLSDLNRRLLQIENIELFNRIFKHK